LYLAQRQVLLLLLLPTLTIHTPPPVICSGDDWLPSGASNGGRIGVSGGGGAENASTGKRKYGKGKYETAHFARMENACTENTSTMQTFSQIKKVRYFTS